MFSKDPGNEGLVPSKNYIRYLLTLGVLQLNLHLSIEILNLAVGWELSVPWKLYCEKIDGF